MDFCDAVGAQEPGDEDVGLWEVQLFGRPVCFGRGDSPVAAALPVEDRPEQARGVETWATVPVDRPLGAHERDRVEVTDEAVFGYRQGGNRVGRFWCPCALRVMVRVPHCTRALTGSEGGRGPPPPDRRDPPR